MSKRRRKKRSHDSFLFWDAIPEQVNTTIASRPSVEPAARKVLDLHHKRISRLVKNTAVDVDAANVFNPSLDADFDCVEAYLHEREPERVDFLELLRGAQRAGLLFEEAFLDRLGALDKSIEESLAAAMEEEIL